MLASTRGRMRASAPTITRKAVDVPIRVKLPKSEVHCMKDVNDLMQAILEMDAAQRRESEKARLERSARLAALDEQKQKIIAECDAREKSESEAAAKAAEEGNAAALAALETQRSQAAEAMTAAAKAHEAEWCAALVQRTLGGEAAQ